MAKIIVNDEAQEREVPITLDELIRLNNVFQPEMVTVQVNEEFVDRDDWARTVLKDGDKVDFIYFMGGGSVYD